MANTETKTAQATEKFKKNQKIGFLAFLAVTCAMVITIYEYPAFASAGWALILYLLLTALCFFLPLAIIAAEMGTVKRWEKGGIFVWVSQTLGRRWGFLAIFYQWFAITIAFLAMLFFISSALGFGFGGPAGFNLVTQGNDGNGHGPFQLTLVESYNKQLAGQINDVNNLSANSKLTVTGALSGVMIVVFLIVTATQLFGVKYTSLIARVGFVIGIAVPTLVLIILGSIYISNHNGSEIINNIEGKNVPDATGSVFVRGNAAFKALSLLVSVVLSFIGVEGSGTLANNLKKVNRNYPLAVITLLGVALLFSTLGGIMIAASTTGEISMTGGVIVAMVNLLISDGASFNVAMTITRVFAFLMACGVIAQIASWVIGPAQGLKFASDQKLIPAVFGKQNRYNVPIVNVGLQTIVVIAWILIIVLGLGNAGGNSFQAGMSATVIVYLSAYFIVMCAYLKMVLKGHTLQRAFRIKSRVVEIVMLVLFFLITCLAFVVSFLNPSSSDPTTNGPWYGILVVLSLVGISLPFGIYELYSRWQKKHNVNLDEFKIVPLKEQVAQDATAVYNE